MAARAAGIDMQHRAMFGGDAEPGYYKYPPGVPPLWTWWNPLTDDGHALRLAVKLRINLHFCESDAMTTAYAEGGIQGAAVDFMDDPYAATRRAIVRAAAELARAGAQKG